ncbi:MAG: DUF3854 domain-containing protein [Proteobacteria bacterium]|nr:DUF3854 domain-containing protein [Pseudomonadota bacterium]
MDTIQSSLHPLHHQNLQRDSGLSDKTIQEAKIYSVRPSDIPKKLGWNGQGIQSLLAFPYPGCDGFERYKAFYNDEHQGKRHKYLQKKDSGNHLYITEKVRPALQDANTPLYLTEGEKKSLKACQEGLCCIGLSGLWNWSDGNKNLIPDFDLIALQDRIINIIPDNDWKSKNKHGYKKNLVQAVNSLAYKLKERGADVYIVELPQGSEKGLDDYLINHSIEDFKTLSVAGVKTLMERAKEATYKTYKFLLPEIAGVDPIEQEILIKTLSKQIGVSVHSIRKALKANALVEVTVADDNIIIAHPSYEINQGFISIGFKETVITDNRPDSRNVYLVCKDNEYKLHEQSFIETDTGKIIFDVRERVLITLHDKWSKAGILDLIKNPIAPEELYNEIKGILKRYVEFQNNALYGLVAAWIIATYFHRIFNAFPFLFFYGKKQSGKSRMLDLLNLLTFNAIKVKGISVPSMSDSIDGVRATFLMDQAEILSQKQNIELLGLLADSYTPGGGKRRIVHITNKSRKVVEFETYSPKAFASIKEIDSDLKDRCIEIIMIRAAREYCYPEPFLPIWGELRDKLYRLLLTQWREVREIYQTAGLDMTQRIRELWRPLDTILTLENVLEEERQTIKNAFLESMLETQTGLSELEEKLIQAIDDLLGYSGQGVFTTTEITEKMDLPDIEEFKKKDQVRWAGRTVNKLYLYTKKLGRSGNKHKYLFDREHLNNILKRYKIDDFNGATAESNTDATLQDAIEKSGNGATADLMAQDADNAISAISVKTNGTPESVDNKQSCHCAVEAINLMTDDNIFIPEDDIPEIEGEKWEY